jgi:VWFA-related protein
MRLKWVVPVGVFFFASALLAAQQGSVFRAQANYVEVDAIVTDRAGAFVQGLTAADFEVREGRAVQPIGAFSYVDIPQAGTVPSVVVTPVRFRADLPDSLRVDATRIYLLYLNGVGAGNIVHLRNYAKAFVEQWMQPTDIAAVWDGGIAGGGDVTISNDKAVLLEEIDSAGFRHAAGGAVLPGSPVGLRNAIDWLSAVQGRRKSLILFSGGMSAARPNSEISRLVGGMPLSGLAMFLENDLTSLVERADVHIYPCDIRGLVAPDLHLQAAALSGINAMHPAAGAEFRSIVESTENMKAIAEATGGLAMVNTNDYGPGFDRIVADNSRYYLLGYDSTSKVRPGEFRTIDVRLTRPGLSVRARKGYVVR